MTLEQNCNVNLPHFKLNDKLQKENLFNFCVNDDSIADYLPDNAKSESISRDLLLSVSIFNYSQVDLFFEKGLFPKTQ